MMTQAQWLSVLAGLAIATASGAQTTTNAPDGMMDVNVGGMKVGKFTVKDNQIIKPTGAAATNGFVQAKITADFMPMGGQAAVDKINTTYPQGLGYMQTVMLMFDEPFGGLLDKNDDLLSGTFSDPPQGGYRTPTGGTAFTNDKTPWYSTLTPGNPPATVNWTNGPNAQFYDGPSLNLADIAGTGDLSGMNFNGVLSSLNMKDGMLKFETALVGVKSVPDAGEEMTGKYMVEPLKTFEWGINFKYVDNSDGKYDLADFELSFKGMFGGMGVGETPFREIGTEVSDSFKMAFDGGTMEWDVCFIPAPGSAAVLCLSGLLAVRRRRS